MADPTFYFKNNAEEPVPGTFLHDSQGGLVVDPAWGRTFLDSSGKVVVDGKGPSYQLYTDSSLQTPYSNPNGYLVVPIDKGSANEFIQEVLYQQNLPLASYSDPPTIGLAVQGIIPNSTYVQTWQPLFAIGTYDQYILTGAGNTEVHYPLADGGVVPDGQQGFSKALVNYNSYIEGVVAATRADGMNILYHAGNYNSLANFGSRDSSGDFGSPQRNALNLRAGMAAVVNGNFNGLTANPRFLDDYSTAITNYDQTQLAFAQPLSYTPMGDFTGFVESNLSENSGDLSNSGTTNAQQTTQLITPLPETGGEQNSYSFGPSISSNISVGEPGNSSISPSSDPIQDVLNSASGALNSLSDAIASFVPTISGSNPSPSGNIATPLVTDPGAGGNHLGSVLGTESKNAFGEIVGEVVNTVVNTVINLISSALGWLPVVLDLTGKGINITQETSSNTFFDGAGDGEQHQTAWAGAGNAVLFYDPTGTGSLTRADQVVFTDLDPSASNDMQALEDVFDTNHNGSLDAGDASYGNFYLDVTNANGTHTIESLTQAGITAINLTPNAVNQKLPDGSAIQGETTYTTSSGSTGAAATVSFAADATGYAVASTAGATRRNRACHARARRRVNRDVPRGDPWRFGHKMQPENLVEQLCSRWG